MKRTTQNLVWVALLALVMGCNPLLPNPRFAGEPRILSLRFPNIPAEAVSIDNKNKVIKVKLPAVLPPIGLPEIEVAGNAFSGLILWINVFTEDGPDHRKIELYGLDTSTDAKPAQVVATYRVEFVPAGALEVDTEAYARNPPPETGTTNLYVPFKNLYANALPVAVRFTNVATKEVSVIDSLSPNLVRDDHYGRFVSRSWGTSAGQMNLLVVDVAAYGAKVVPGSYQVAFVKKDGTIINLPRPFTFRAGAMLIKSAWNDAVPIVPPGQEFVITGRNLYKTDVTVKVLDSTDREVPLADLQFDPYGNRISLTMAGTAEGRHVVQTINQFGSKICQLIEVTTKPIAATTLDIIKVGWTSDYCSIKVPLLLPKNQETLILLREPASDVQLRLTSVKGSSQDYVVGVKIILLSDGSYRNSFSVPGMA